MALCDIGITGLSTMGGNLARNAAHKGFGVAVHNRSRFRTDDLIRDHGGEGRFVPAYDIPEFVAAIARPRPILIMVKAGKPVDDVIDEIAEHLDPGDILIDGGNSLFGDTQRRGKALEARGLKFIGMGVSGGEEGALEGPSMMPGGDPDAYARVQPIFEKMAAQVDGVPCCTYIGTDGAGHYVKMVHNGIEYADMQLIAEAYDLMRSVYGLDAARMADIFAGWKTGDLDSYLIEITAAVLRKVDASTGKPLVDLILDEAEQKGTGRWTAQNALELGVPITAITEAVFARVISSFKDERVAASHELGGAKPSTLAPEDAALASIRDALYASKIIAYAQGFEQMAKAATQYNWALDLGKIATIWRGGCIIRAKFLDRIKEAYADGWGEKNLLLAPYFRDGVARCDDAWRRVVALAVQNGIAVPAFASSLAYYDGYRRERTPANLLQGLRDYFGAHTYKRIDKPGSYHVRWAQDGEEIKTSD
jgi:6-phosphogluconate dehydrogenase